MESKIKGKLLGKKVKVVDVGNAGELYSKGYGIKEGGNILLSLYEATYLTEIGRMEVESEKGILSLEDLSKLVRRVEEFGWTKYIVYRDLRTKGYIVREGFGQGLDFRIYERGTYGEKPAKYVVFAFNEGNEVKVKKIKKIIDLSIRLGKEPILAVVDRRGEVVYYRMFKMGLKF